MSFRVRVWGSGFGPLGSRLCWIQIKVLGLGLCELGIAELGEAESPEDSTQSAAFNTPFSVTIRHEAPKKIVIGSPRATDSV